MSTFRKTLRYGFLDQVAARIFDFATLWVVLRTLPDQDLAVYGIATALLFIFNLVLVTPETALLRSKKKWLKEETIKDHLKGFILFSQLRIIIVILVTVVMGLLKGWDNTYFYACLFGLSYQFIQLAEISRLDFRTDLQQQHIFRSEIKLKALLLVMVSVLFLQPGFANYLIVFLSWAFISAIYWLLQLKRKHQLTFTFQFNLLGNVWVAFREFSFWQNLSGAITYAMYNIDPWILSMFVIDIATISTYTLALKISALFFMLPMFLQSMAMMLIVNNKERDQKERTFAKLFTLNAIVSVLQLLFFVIAGEWLGWLFRGDALQMPIFYEFGLILSAGVFILNIARPLISDLMLHAPMSKLLISVYIPVIVFSFIAYCTLTDLNGAVGCAVASALSYFLFALLLLWQCLRYGIGVSALRRFGLIVR
jgi:O-antigen/teichoic acid export membrane protein